MNEKALSGVLMVAGAGALAWAYFTGRLDSTLAAFTKRATSAAVAVKTAGGGAGNRAL